MIFLYVFCFCFFFLVFVFLCFCVGVFEKQFENTFLKDQNCLFLRMGGGPSTLFDLVESGDKEAVQSLLTSQAADGTLDIDKRHPDFGYTALHFAAKGNYPEIAKMLFQYGSDVNAQNDYGYTPLHLAALWNSVEVGALLIDEHAYVNVGDVCFFFFSFSFFLFLSLSFSFSLSFLSPSF